MPTNHKRILIADDDQLTRSLLGSVLRQEFLHVDEAADGSEALALLADRSYSVALLDVVMPGIDGVRLANLLRASNRETRPIVIVITGAHESFLSDLDPTSVHGIIRKPFDPVEVAQVVRACVEIRAAKALEQMCAAGILASASIIPIVS